MHNELPKFLQEITAADDDAQARAIEAGRLALVGNVQRPPEAEPFFMLAEIGKEVRKHPTWLHKLEIQKHCGERLAGRFMYKKSRVLTYLKSAECQARIAELHDERRRRETTIPQDKRSP